MLRVGRESGPNHRQRIAVRRRDFYSDGHDPQFVALVRIECRKRGTGRNIQPEVGVSFRAAGVEDPGVLDRVKLRDVKITGAHGTSRRTARRARYVADPNSVAFAQRAWTELTFFA